MSVPVGNDAQISPKGWQWARSLAGSPRAWMHLVAILFTLAVAVILCTTGSSPRVGLEHWCSDHYSHTGAAALFLSQGMDMYRRPVRSLCARPVGPLRSRRLALARRLDVNPVDICYRRGAGGAPSGKRALVINWQRYPRPYPPGVMVYFLPEALLWEHTNASFATVNRVTIVKLLVVGHLAWVVLTLLLGSFRPTGLAWAIMAIGYSQLIYWSAVGIYDGVALLFVLLSMLAIQRRRGSLAALSLSLACLLHFRGLWYLPLLAPALAFVVGNGEIKQRRRVCALGLALLIFAATAYVFWILWPALQTFPQKNPVGYRKLALASPAHWAILLPTAGVVALLVSRRFWLGAGLILWLLAFLLRTPQTMSWHALSLLPILALPAMTLAQPTSQRDRHRLPYTETTVALLLFYLAASEVVFRASIWPGWIASLLRRMS